MIGADGFDQNNEMIADENVGRSVAQPMIHRSRTAQVSKQNDLRPNRDLFGGRNDFGGKKITKFLPVGHAGGGEDVLAPIHLFHAEQDGEWV